MSKKSIFLLLCLLAPVTGRADFIRNISSREGLSNNSVLSLAQDPLGRIWTGTCEGLNIWDGVRMTSYSTHAGGKGALSGNLIEKIHFCPGLGAWIVTDYGLDLIDENMQIRRYDQFRGMYRMLAWDSASRCMVLTQAGKLFRFDGTDFHEIPCPSLLRHGRLLDSRSMGETLLICTSEGLFMAGDDMKELTPAADIRLRFAQCHAGEAYLVGEDGILYRYDYREGRLSYQTGLQEEIRRHGEIRSIVRDGDDIVIGFLFDGVTRLVCQPEKAERYRHTRLEIQCGVFDILRDATQDILWVATDGYGLQMYARGPYTFHNWHYGRIGSYSTPVRALCKDRRGNLWVGTKGEGLMQFPAFTPGKDAPSVHRTFTRDLSDPAVFALKESRRPLLWIGTEGIGIDYYSYTDRKIHHLAGDLPEALRYIHCFQESEDGTLWAASVGKGVFKITLGGKVDRPEALSCRKLDFGPLRNDSEFYFTMTEDRDGSLWIGSRGSGLIHYDPATDSSRVYTLDDTGSPASNDIWSVFRDSHGRLWIGTGGGLFRFGEDGMTSTAVVCLIHGIVENPDGDLWLSTNNGLIRYFPQTDDAFRFGHNFGLKTLEFSDGAAFTDREGLSYFGATNGFTVIEESPVPFTPRSPALSILGFKKNGKSIPLFRALPDNTITLQPGEWLESVEISAMDFVDTENYRYFYRIAALGGSWNECQRNVTLPRLPGGTYTLELRCENPGSGFVSPVTALKIEVLSPFYLTTAAKAFYLLLGLCLLWGTLRLLTARNEKKYRKRLEELEKMRKEELHASQLKLLRDVAVQIERPSLMLAAPIHQILNYSRADEYVRACAENARHYNDKINHTLQLFHELTGDEEKRQHPDVMMFSPHDILSELMETYSDIAGKRKVAFRYEIPPHLIWVGSPRLLVMTTDMILTDLFYHLTDGGCITLELSGCENEEALRMHIGTDGNWPDLEKARLMLDENQALDYIQSHLRKSLTIQDEMRLAVCRNWVAQMGGEISVGQEGEKRIFRITLPRMILSEDHPAGQQEMAAGDIADGANYAPAAHLLQKTELPESPLPGPDMKSMFVLAVNSDVNKSVTLLFQNDFEIRIFSRAEDISAALEGRHPDIVIGEWMGHAPETEALILSLKENKATVQIPVILIAQEQGDLPADAWVTLPLNAKALKFAVEQSLRRTESLKSYFNSQLSIYAFSDGRQLHREDKEFLEKLYRVIRNNLQRSDLTTAVIASEMNMSLRKLYSRMNGLVNITPSNIIREYRLTYAAQLLLKTKLTTSEIIWQAGFTNRGTFFKNFQEKYGCTPKAYRQARGESAGPSESE